MSRRIYEKMYSTVQYNTVCPKRLGPIYIVILYKMRKTTWEYSTEVHLEIGSDIQ